MAGTILDPVKVATNVNITDIATKNWQLGTEAIDGVTDLLVGDRVLVKAQTFKVENGIYVFTTVNVSGVDRIRLVRSTDFKSTAPATVVQPNTIVFVTSGDIHADTGWLLSNNSAATVGVADIEFKRFTINPALGGLDLPSSLVLRKENGRPLTNDQLDGNFKFLYDSLVSKLDISGFTPASVRAKVNTSTNPNISLAEEANLDAWKLRGKAAAAANTPDTVVLRDTNSAIFSTLFVGNLQGNAATADLADFATLAGNVTGIVSLANGGTGASTAATARNNLNVVSREGDTISGKVFLTAGSSNTAPLNLSLGVPSLAADGDFWAAPVTVNGQIADYRLYYRFNGITRSIAHIESPAFEGVPTVPNVAKAANNSTIANTKFVQDHVADINTALNLKANLQSPALTGTPTTPTAATTTENTQIASTAYVKNKIVDSLTPYDTIVSVNGKINGLRSELNVDIEAAQETADEALSRSGLPVGAVAYFASNSVPLGWLEANGAQVNKNAYPKLFEAIGYTYGGSGDFFRLPDLRGEFLRGWDNGRGADANRAFGSSQSATAIRTLIDQYAQGSGAKLDGTFVYKTRYPLGTLAVTGSNIDGFVTPPTGDESIMRYNRPGEVLGSYDPTAGTPANWATSALGTVNVSSNNLYYTASVTEQSGSGDNISFRVRPRNVAMLPCIKAFGLIDDVSNISLSTALNEINGRVRLAGDAMTGFLFLHANPTNNMHAATKQYVDTTVAGVSLLPGPPGPVGPAGPQGVQGPTGPAGPTYTFTYGQTGVDNYTNIVGSFADTSTSYQYDSEGNYVGVTTSLANQFDVFPPSGKSMSNLRAFIPSIRTIYFAGRVDGNDALRCEYEIKSDRITVFVQNTEQRYNPTASWLAIWS